VLLFVLSYFASSDSLPLIFTCLHLKHTILHLVLTVAFIYADMEDSMSARMILSGVPLEDAYLQSRLATMSQLERKGFKEGKLPIDDCFYLMGTTDPTGKLRPNEVCVIL
jgi:RNA-dependent RNA polymerase